MLSSSYIRSTIILGVCAPAMHICKRDDMRCRVIISIVHISGRVGGDQCEFWGESVLRALGYTIYKCIEYATTGSRLRTLTYFQIDEFGKAGSPDQNRQDLPEAPSIIADRPAQNHGV